MSVVRLNKGDNQMTDKWLFISNYKTEERANESKEAHIKTWGDLYPDAEYRIEYHQTFCDNYLLYVNLHENERAKVVLADQLNEREVWTR